MEDSEKPQSKQSASSTSDSITHSGVQELQATNINESTGAKRNFAFWMVFVANLTVDMLSALDLTAVSTALPTIVEHLHGTDFIWAGSAFTIASTAILPLVGGLVSVFGRKPILLFFVSTFAVGSAIAGASQSMNMLIAGRAIQGFGGGGCLSVTEIIYADLVPLPERGKFQGITASVWALACAIGPPIGGALATSGAWRWLFFMNLPICGLAITLVFFFLRVHTPTTDFKENAKRIDWIGNTIIIGSTISILLALTWGGLQFPWTSAHVLAPLIIGAIGILVFFVVEALWIKEPTMPRFCFTNRTTLSGYLGTFFHGIVSLSAIYYLPVYFQAAKGASATGSGVDLFGLVFIIPTFAILTGLSTQVFGRYRPQNWVGWAFTVLGFGIITILKEDTSRSVYIGSQIPLGVGLGIVWIGTQFPILAPLPYSNNAHALAFFTFVRCFAQSWGIVIGGTILQNTLLRKLPASFVSTLPQGVQIAYSIIPQISGLPPPLQKEVRVAFAESTRLIWQVMIGFSGAGLLTCLLMREVPLKTVMDETWGLKEKEKEKEKGDAKGDKTVAAAV